jgi:helix-turn-helix protein
MPRGIWIKGPYRKTLAELMAQGYAEGLNIRQLRDLYGVSYGLVRDLLVEQGVTLRGRGGRRGRRDL